MGLWRHRRSTRVGREGEGGGGGGNPYISSINGGQHHYVRLCEIHLVGRGAEVEGWVHGNHGNIHMYVHQPHISQSTLTRDEAIMLIFFTDYAIPLCSTLCPIMLLHIPIMLFNIHQN